jgi:2'-hydroxyisoflavone reductase
VVYNALKAGCERAVEQYFDGPALILNPGLIVGPHENSGRLLWWLLRVARGGRVLAPGGDPGREMQLIDARDIAEFGIEQLTAGTAGRSIVNGEPGSTTPGALLAECAAVTGADAELVWADDAFLLEQGVGVWTELPMWSPAGVPAGAGTWLASPEKAVAAGLRCRPVAETVRDTWEWLLSAGLREVPARPGAAPIGITPEREAAVLAAWDAHLAQSAAKNARR